MSKLSVSQLLTSTFLKQVSSIPLVLFLTIQVLTTRLAFAEDGSNKHAKLMGVATCASSNCHGNSAPVAGSEILQNEFVTWYRHDKHSRAYSVLLNAQSKRIAYNLGIKSAEGDSLCISCHATAAVDANKQGEKYRIEDGVSCESCHGSSESWLKAHVARDATYSNNVSLGMTDLRNPKVKVELCLSCHIGNDDKSVNHRLIGAGHPRLTFELDTFESVMPRHWKLQTSEQSSEYYNSADAWLKAQVIQAAERTKALSSKTRSHAGIFPEFSNLHCYSCHHSLSQQQYQSREYGGKPGEANLNTSELWVLSKALLAIDKNRAQKLSSKIAQLREQFGKQDVSTISSEINTILSVEILPSLISRKLTKEEQQTLFSELISTSTLNLQYETAEQIAMGAASIAAANPESEEMKKKVADLYKALKNPEIFDPHLFTIHKR